MSGYSQVHVRLYLVYLYNIDIIGTEKMMKKNHCWILKFKGKILKIENLFIFNKLHFLLNNFKISKLNKYFL